MDGMKGKGVNANAMGSTKYWGEKKNSKSSSAVPRLHCDTTDMEE